MPDQRQTPAFAPEQYFSEGPFSAQLQPTGQGGELANPGAKIPRTAAAAGIIDKFLHGLQAGRAQAFAREEYASRRQTALLTGKIERIMQDPSLTPEGKQAATQPLYRALGQVMAGSIDGAEQTQPKKKKGQAAGEEGQQPKGAGHHLLGLAKDFAVGLAGGKYPKQLDPKTLKQITEEANHASDLAMYGPDGKGINPKYDLRGLTTATEADLEKAAKGLQGKTWEDAGPALQQYFNRADQLDPKLGQRLRQDYQARFQDAPKPGSKEYYGRYPEKWAEDFEKTVGRKPNEDERARFFESVGGLKPSNVLKWGKPMLGSAIDITRWPATRQGKPIIQDGQHQYIMASEGDRELGFDEVVGKAPTATQQSRSDALRAWSEKHGKPPDYTPTGQETLEALSEYKNAILPTDVKKLHEVNQQIKEEQLKQFHEGTASLETIAKGVINHTLPPDLGGLRLYGKEGERLIAKVQELDPTFNWKNARLDYLGQQSYMRTLNSQQQVRLRQAVEFPLESLNLIDDGKGHGFSPDLSKHLDRTKYPLVNKAAMAAALNGTMGQEAEDAARALDIQIRDLQAEIAVVYKGGNSPTDKGLKQAQEILNGEWNEESLRKAIELSRTNLKLRLGSIANTKPYTFSDDAPPGASNREPNTPPGGGGHQGPKAAIDVHNVSGIRRDGQFVPYANEHESFQATVKDIRAKMSGATDTGLTGKSSLDDLVTTWTTGGLSGVGAGYSAKDVAGYLKKFGVKAGEDTEIDQIDPTYLAAAISYFETGYRAKPEDLDPYASPSDGQQKVNGLVHDYK